ncbi:hypothetical protein LTR91_001744 [Friedmanniomyces endolithicus]|uniref:Fe2OG dioxygenase domain-containing protein n=1 Tax=Friedmanniomyces endolithicus TaxID=329885 RepID=A0AAN6L1E4_9PEZI|nr:hypothetical protein LTR35_003919 [Friedmanniomyces endolithicus]KAK0324936.1 hypothetical protein LTR82_003922 [Friedmanniomyces endolithicus]KAK1000035.1 hypothetical protein LTR54_008958 [Friedmanniomyces endolithicus]KAK1004619.1 hypothetical protein LTS01_003629 [Friedmanniomyces endolithicus]KAK1012501.1 hypothetical protein LTR91_001744 [Friedmanniomyces endolithicus]
MASLSALLSQQGTTLQTRKGLILLGLQNDFLSPEGKLPVSTKSGFLERLKQLVPSFREFGDIIWVRSEFEANRNSHDGHDSGDTVIAGASATADNGKSIKEGSKRCANDDTSACVKRIKATDVEEDDPELFLTRTSTREPCCLRGTWGAEHPPDVNALIDKTKDMQVVKNHYSAFGSGRLLSTLRSRLITELYVCGCNTNLSVFATAMDAARHGIQITLIEDCLGFRKKDRHDEAIRQLVEIFAADVLTSAKVIDVLKNPPEYHDEEEDDVDESDEDEYATQDLAQLNVSHKPYNYALSGKPSSLDMAAVLDIDSDEDEEEDMVLHQVRSLHSLSAELALRNISTHHADLRPLVADPEQTPQRAEPECPHPPNASTMRADDVPAARPAEFQGVRASHLGSVQSEVELARHGGGVVDLDGGEGKGDANVDLEADKSSTDELGSPVLAGQQNDSSHKGGDSNKSTAVESVGPSGVKAQPATTPSASDPESSPSREGVQMEGKDALPKTLQEQPLFGKDKEVESAGSRISYNLLSPELSELVFSQLNSEVQWQRMHHQTGEVPRLVCCQGTIAKDGSMPVYRHPSDETLPLRPWSPTVEKVRQAAEQAVGHPLNHALIQLYRGGTDYISEHSDKTLDIMEGSSIVNVSFGAQRTMRLRTKRGAALTASTSSPSSTEPSSSPTQPPPSRTTYRVPMPHNSILTMTLRTNAEYLHGITADKRPAVELSSAEKAYNGQRISLTFRRIATFLDAEGKEIWGQGAVGKTRESARLVVSGNKAESERLVRAFGAENAASGIEWASVYGEGSDVLHLGLVRREAAGE